MSGNACDVGIVRRSLVICDSCRSPLETAAPFTPSVTAGGGTVPLAKAGTSSSPSGTALTGMFSGEDTSSWSCVGDSFAVLGELALLLRLCWPFPPPGCVASFADAPSSLGGSFPPLSSTVLRPFGSSRFGKGSLCASPCSLIGESAGVASCPFGRLVGLRSPFASGVAAGSDMMQSKHAHHFVLLQSHTVNEGQYVDITAPQTTFLQSMKRRLHLRLACTFPSLRSSHAQAGGA